MKSATQQITRTLIRIWNSGVPLTGDVLFFLDSAVGLTLVQEIEDALTDEDFPDRETVIEMALFPDTATRLVIEPHLSRSGCDRNRISAVTDGLFSAFPVLNMVHPESSRPLAVRLSFHQVEQYVSRLYLNVSLDNDICRALAACRTHPETLLCRVFLRCQNTPIRQNATPLLIQFINRTKDIQDDFSTLFQFLITLLADAPPSASVGIYLHERLRHEKKQLLQLDEFEEKLARYTMEYLMLSGFQTPSGSRDNIKARIRMLNRIINDILCIPAPLHTGIQPRSADIGRFRKTDELHDLFRFLS